MSKCIKPEMYIETYNKVSEGTERWNALPVNSSLLYNWN
jgi:aconitase A